MNLFAFLHKKGIQAKKTASFIYFILRNNIFKLDPCSSILLILSKLIELEHKNFKGTVCYRTPKDSTNLFKALTKTYLENKSSRTLEQLTVVFRDEIIGRENSGR